MRKMTVVILGCLALSVVGVRVLGAKEHEMHHRGQLMLIERQLGIVPHLTRQGEERMKQLRAAKA